ncbi:MAG: LysR family transcriptional regulator, partial [Cyanobacteria bacterium]|nr:LysR family transcriptional regulator [Cyanobacteriota bacterium]
MELRHLRYFVAVATYLNVTEASQHLHVAQPSVSQQIADLERELGFALLRRNNRGVKLTAAGEVFYKEAQALLDQSEKAVLKARRAHGGYIGNLSVGFMEAAVIHFLPQLIQTYRQDYPDVELSLRHMNPVAQLEALQAGTIDIGFLRNFQQKDYGFLEQREVYMDQLVAILPKEHPLANQSKLSIKQLEAEPFVLFKRSEAPELFDEIVTFCKNKGGFSPNVQHEPDLMQTVLWLTQAGLGVSIAASRVQSL